MSEAKPEQRTELEERRAHHPFPIVGIGASAGGLEALRALFAELPGDAGMTFVIVQHLDPRHESRLSDLLSKASKMPVLEAMHGLTVERDHVYVIPPNTNLALGEGKLIVTPRGDVRGPHLPVDHLFRSLAEDQQLRAIGVVLSGSGTDGTLGLCEIKAVGGITFAQDEKTAGHTGMPRSASESGCADFVLAPQAIAKRLLEIATHPYLIEERHEGKAQREADTQYKKILATVRAVLGVDFSQYRDTTIHRRIMRRMALHSQESLGEYARRLESDRSEVESLYHDLLINVTSFFRDADMFEALKQRVFPEIVKARSPNTPVRVWVPGCSTGQEAYSLAMSLIEFFDDRPVRPQLHIFATDLSDERALEKARAGVYPESIEAELSPERLRRFFRKEDHVYRIDKRIRDMCVFARHNVTADPPFSHLDLISCRNVLIYLATPLQKRVLPTFHYALNVPGYLVLGTAETIGDHTDLFDLADRGNKIYSKKAAAARPPVHFVTEDFKASASIPGRRAGAASQSPLDFQKEADRILLGRYAPPGVLVNENLDILQFRGRVGAYLEAPPGEPTTNLLKMARQGLFLDLRSALTEAATRNTVVRRDDVRVRVDGNVREVQLEVVRVKPPTSSEACFLVLFHERDEQSADSAAAPSTDGANVASADAAAAESASVRELAQMRQELSATKDYMQSLVEQQDAANEELRSANEEILSSNEELQSTNEELETAKEELQSVNEELTTVNEQLQHRNGELAQVNNDLTNLLSSTTIPVVMVGGDLRIRRFTAPAKKAMRLLPTDVGRPIGDIKPAALVPDLEHAIVEVIETVQAKEREITDQDGRWHQLRIHPYRTADNKIDGAVLFLVDIDQLKRARSNALESEEKLKIALDAARMGTWSVDLKTATLRCDRTCCELLEFDPAHPEVPLEMFWQRVHPDDVDFVRRSFDAAINETPTPIEYRVVLPGAGTRWRYVNGIARRDGSGAATQLVGVSYDITERKAAEAALREADQRKDEFLAMLAHELRNPLGPIRNAIEVMRLAGDDASMISSVREVMDRQVRQLSRIVDDLIDVSRIVEQKIALKRERIELGAVIATAIETCRSMMEANRHHLSVTVPGRSLYLDADPARLTQVLVNLLNNAGKFTDAGGNIRLFVETTREDGAGKDPTHVAIHVVDDGIGIPAELLPRVFDLYTQGDASIERSRGGLGIGLSLVQSLVQMHGGDVEARSAGRGKGSEFVVRLPLSGPPSAAPAAPAPRERTRTQKQHKRVLVVDDSVDQAESLSKLLALLGHEVSVARDGQQALDVAAEFQPDVALVDIGLPRMNGYEVAKRLRQQARFKNLVLVAQTGWGGTDDRQRSQDAGFDHHVVKPIDIEELTAILNTPRQPRSGGA